MSLAGVIAKVILLAGKFGASLETVASTWVTVGGYCLAYFVLRFILVAAVSYADQVVCDLQCFDNRDFSVCIPKCMAVGVSSRLQWFLWYPDSVYMSIVPYLNKSGQYVYELVDSVVLAVLPPLTGGLCNFIGWPTDVQ